MGSALAGGAKVAATVTTTITGTETKTKTGRAIKPSTCFPIPAHPLGEGGRGSANDKRAATVVAMAPVVVVVVVATAITTTVTITITITVIVIAMATDREVERIAIHDQCSRNRPGRTRRALVTFGAILLALELSLPLALATPCPQNCLTNSAAAWQASRWMGEKAPRKKGRI